MNTQDKALGQFLRAQRERLSPQDVGLPSGQRRRAPGLRREEVAQLAGISATWLTWIEQGRTQSVSADALSRLAAALRLSPAERDYLFGLAGLKDPAPVSAPTAAPDDLLDAVDAIATPAYVLDEDWDARAWNAAAAALFRDWLGRPGGSRNLVDYMFLDPAARDFVADWAVRARRMVAELRADLGPRADTPATRRWLDGLSVRSADFDALWHGHDVLGREGGERVFQHPAQGRLVYRQLTLRLASAPGLKLVMLLPQPGGH